MGKITSMEKVNIKCVCDNPETEQFLLFLARKKYCRGCDRQLLLRSRYYWGIFRRYTESDGITFGYIERDSYFDSNAKLVTLDQMVKVLTRFEPINLSFLKYGWAIVRHDVVDINGRIYSFDNIHKLHKAVLAAEEFNRKNPC